MRFNNAAEVTAELAKFIPQLKVNSWVFALEQMKDLMAALGNPQEKVKVIHVAGTSGKTSTAYYITEMLRQAGKKVGLTVSPHVDTVNERIQLNGQPLPEAEFCELFGEFMDLPVLQNFKPSYFGLLVAFAFWVFAKKDVDYAVIEVGLGGRLDASNVITRADKVSVITDIGLDHIDLLGDNIVAIAGEKAGIIQKGNQVFMAKQDDEIVEVMQGKADAVDATLMVLQPADAPTSLPLFQQRNWSLARAVVDYVAQRDGFTFNQEQAAASAKVSIPGRMERTQYSGKTIITDGAHNSQKIIALCDSIKQLYPGQKLAAVVSFAQGKDTSLDESMAALHEVVSSLIVTSFKATQDVPKQPLELATLQTAAQKAGIANVEVIEDPQAAFRALLQKPDKLLLVTGSFYLLNHIRPLIKELG